MIVSAFLLNLLLLLPTPVDALVVQFPLKGKVSLSLGTKGKADVERKGTVMRVSVELQDLQPAQDVLAGMNSYVVWAVSPEGSFDNLGELDISGSKGSLEATTRFDRFAVLITLEPHYMVDKPTAAIMFKNEAARSVRSLPVKVELGTYEYANLPRDVQGVPMLVMEARAAVAIAASAQADRLAESEFRQAKVSLDTMEELFARAAADEVVLASAHEAIRRAQRAVTLARQSSR